MKHLESKPNFFPL